MHNKEKNLFFLLKMQEQAQFYIKDYKQKTHKKFFRPYFSPKTG
jgi:hypothetical protein